MLFEEQIARKPNLYPWAEQFIEAMHNGFWTDKEFSFASDVHQFKTELSGQEKEIITRCLSAIGQIEVAVKKFWAKLGDNLPHPSITDLGYTMANVEVIHNNAYERLLKVLDLEHIFEENLKLDIILGRVNYLRKYNHKYYADSKKQYIYSIILFTLFVENVSLFSQFYTILYFNRYKNVLKDTAQQIQYTKNEELIHALVGMKIINVLRNEYPELFDKDLENRILHEAEQAFNAEAKIIDWMLNGYSEDKLNPTVVKEYVKNRINESLNQIGFKHIFDVDKNLINKTIWMEEEVHGNSMTDFFQKKPTEYLKKSQAFDASNIF